MTIDALPSDGLPVRPPRAAAATADAPEVVLGETESVCPACLARVRAWRVARGEDVYLRKDCPAHGRLETIVWRGRPDFRSWIRPRTAVPPERPSVPVERGCPFDCGLCADHRQQSCCVLLEVTLRCDLRCPFCFASAGHASCDPTLERLDARLRRLYEAAGPVNLQLSGGEPCVRDDLPEIAARAREIGFRFIQVNTNGLRLARDRSFAQRLRDAGVATVFLQFDGTRDEIFERMRGRPLLARKVTAIEHSGAAGLGVVLVPTVVPGVNADNLGDILRFAIAHQPIVRGVHFQPVSYFGRYPTPPTDDDRITLPEIIAGLEAQTDGLVRIENFQPAGAENALCSFNGSFVSLPDGRLHALTRARAAASCCAPAAPAEASSSCCEPAEAVNAASGCSEPPRAAEAEPLEAVDASSSCCSTPGPAEAEPSCCKPAEPGRRLESADPVLIDLTPRRRPIVPVPVEGGVGRARDFVARAWAAPQRADQAGTPAMPSLGELDVFLARAKTHTLAISGMAFQDAWTLDLDRLRDCHIHIADPGGADIPFCAYNLTGGDGRALYRRDPGSTA